MRVSELLKKLSLEFEKSKSLSPKLDAEILVSHLIGVERGELLVKNEFELSREDLLKLEPMVKRRVDGEPISYILGYKDFYKSRFKVTKDVLVPRPETEHIVERALSFIENSEFSAPIRIVDLGCGSGCLGLSLLIELSQAELLSVDISAAAIEVAQENSANLGLEKRSTTIKLDAGEILPAHLPEKWHGECDLVVANPPYIDKNSSLTHPFVIKHEPHLALFSEQQGLAHICSWAERATHLLAINGALVFEIGEDQGHTVDRVLGEIGALGEIKIENDYAGQPRVAFAKKVKPWTL